MKTMFGSRVVLPVLALGVLILFAALMPGEAFASTTVSGNSVAGAGSSAWNAANGASLGEASSVFTASIGRVPSLLAEFAKPVLVVIVGVGFLVFMWAKGDEGKQFIMRGGVGALGCIGAVTLGSYFLSSGAVL